MNGRMIVYVLGRVMLICGVLMLLPLLVVFLYQEKTAVSFIIPIVVLIGGGFGISFRSLPTGASIRGKDFLS